MLKIAIQIATFLMLTLPGVADDWVAIRLRGSAEQMSHGQWIPLVRGASVLDGQKVRTGADGRVELVRGSESIQLDPGTQIELHEGQGNTTSIEMMAGIVTADVERRNVQHFSVQTPYLAAVVKGTRFSVTVAGSAARVEVDRGTVQVQDTVNDLVVDIVRGQEALVSQATPLEVSGPGTIAVFTFEGQRVVNGTADVPADQRGQPVDLGNANSGNSSGNAGGNGNGNSSNSNSGGNGNGNSSNNNSGGNGNGNSSNSNSGGNGNGNSGNNNAGGNGNGNSDNSNAGGNANGNSGNSNAGGNGNSGNGESGNSNAGGNGNGNGRGNGKE